MKLLDPLLATLPVLRRVLAVGALSAFVVLGTAACDDVLPDVDTEQQDDGDQDDQDGDGDDQDDQDGDGDDQDDQDGDGDDQDDQDDQDDDGES
ncbi:DNA primase [Streptomonospora nanhaiensis]|uniref:DNA primase n=1 Tax=Streptomonospora nanhaiensis TaxID=1323731 RepID=A0ABY6YH30_9ACTN|nr:DNA primase [Streptomonospora nanhaiensis]WAE71585.1 DNA primase [Streptomonospora nanhaiensis]